MEKKHFKKVVVGFLSAGFLLSTMLLTTSCTRDVESKIATVHLGLPKSSKVGGLSGNDKLNHVIINVRGPGISKPLYLSWDGHDSAAAAPTSFAMDIPTGSARLFQALMVMQDTTTGGMSFYYGDLEATVDSSTNSVTVVTSAIASPSGDGQVTGRMKNTGEPYYTGSIAVNFSPVNGRPPMLIEKSEVFAGWFSLFALDGISFNYIRNDGLEFFGAPKDVGALHAAAVVANATPQLAITVPSYWESHDSPTDPREVRMESTNVYGWFGSDSSNSSKKVCYYSGSTVDLERAYTADAPSTSTLQWNHMTFRDAGGAADASGPAASGQGTCGGTQNFIDVISLDPRSVTRSDGATGFKGPYSRYDYTSNGGGFLSGTVTGSTITMNWNYLPDVAESLPTTKGVAGSDLFMRVIPSGFNGNTEEFRGNDDNVNCAGLSGYGFSKLASIAMPNTFYSFNGSSIMTAQSQGRVQYVLCPYSMASGAKTFYSTAIYEGGYGGGGGGPVQVQFQMASSSFAEGVGSANVDVVLSSSSGATVTVDYNTSGGGTATSSVDYTPQTGTLTFSPGETIKSIFVTINDDAIYEGDETIMLGLSGGTGASFGSPTSHTMTITENDPMPIVQFASSSSSASESVGTHMVEVTLSNPSTSMIMINYSASGGTASGSGVDYTLSPGSLTFSPG
ncbi:MAG: hypothetical protein KDD38_09230, partial [Bdellovibrionales bacterium]|nr:hypothetical protein [Bdellovibrionales bacterium]